MTTINATTARKTLYNLIADVNMNSEPVTITNANGDNAVIISERDWNAINETLYLNAIPDFVESVKRADKEKVSECNEYNPDEEW